MIICPPPMKNSIDGSDITRSWLLALNMRCCPPDTVLAGRPGPELEQHLRLCPLCRRHREDALPQIQLDLIGKGAAENKTPRIGELWSLAGSLAGWGPKCRYYSPPVVLVTGLVDDRAVNVVQTFGDISLSGSDDILLDNGIIGFAEPWNRYTVQLGDLEISLGTVSDRCVQRLIKAMDYSSASVSPSSLLWFFRQMEVETGWYFSRQSIAVLLSSAHVRGDLVSRDTLLEDLRKLPLVLPEIFPDDLPETILARTMPVDDLLPLAAAGLESLDVQILVFIVKDSRVREVKIVEATVTLRNEQDGFLRVSGYCDPGLEMTGQWIFRWQCSQWAIEPLPRHHGAEDGVFWAVFPTETLDDPTSGELIVRVLIYG